MGKQNSEFYAVTRERRRLEEKRRTRPTTDRGRRHRCEPAHPPRVCYGGDGGWGMMDEGRTTNDGGRRCGVAVGAGIGG